MIAKTFQVSYFPTPPPPPREFSLIVEAAVELTIFMQLDILQKSSYACVRFGFVFCCN